jgi:peroxiredoxin
MCSRLRACSRRSVVHYRHDARIISWQRSSVIATQTPHVAATPSLVGRSAPPFTVADPVTHDSVSLSEFAGRNVLLVFLRGTWCPLCVEHLRVLKASYDRLQSANVAVVAVICQSQFSVRLYLQSNPLPFPLLCDGARTVAKAYQTHYWLSHEGFNLSHPALFIIDDKGLVTFAHIGRSMSDLPVSAILEKFLSFLGDTNNT